jgi:hypothetical protein
LENFWRRSKKIKGWKKSKTEGKYAPTYFLHLSHPHPLLSPPFPCQRDVFIRKEEGQKTGPGRACSRPLLSNLYPQRIGFQKKSGGKGLLFLQKRMSGKLHQKQEILNISKDKDKDKAY